jgi:uncharacterized membrane protein
MVKLLVAASIVWPLILAAAVRDRAMAGGGGSLWTQVLYASASHICHQRPERSFHTAGVKWPVCGRCSGLYLAAPVGAIAAAAATRGRRRRRHRLVDRRLVILAVAAVPTVVTMAVEWLGVLPVTTPVRFVAALPLGAAIAFVIASVAAGPPRPMEYTGAA